MDLQHFKQLLQVRHSALRIAIHDALMRSDRERYSDVAGYVHDGEDEALADLLTDINLAEIDHFVEELRDVEAALRRIAVGTYGNCVRCRQPIDPRRLEAHPTAKRCLPCQRQHEQRPPAGAPPTL